MKSKRKVNHRKYLQKQIKRCTGIIAPPPAAPPPSACPKPPPPPRREGSQAGSSLQSRSLAALFGSLQPGRGSAGSDGGGAAGGGPRKVPLRDRNLPPSFFTEPGAKETEKGGGPEAAEFFELLGPEYGALLPEHAAPPQDAFPAGRPPAELGLEHGLYEAAPLPAAPHPLLGGLLYPEPPWSPPGPCSPAKKAPPEALRPLYPEPAAGGDAFGPFFPECPLPPPQMPYDYGGGFHRAAYTGL